MTKVTILGAGVIGMSIASQLPKEAEITIVAEHLPGDDLNPAYTSQWAGAIWLGVHDSSVRERKLQLEAYAALWKIAGKHPESSVKRILLKEVMDYGSPEEAWYRDQVPKFRLMEKHELPAGAKFGMEWETVVITPIVFLPWLRARLESNGVVFRRAVVRSLADLKDMGHDVLVNATGFGAVNLHDVLEHRIVPIKQQNIRIRKPGYNHLYIRRGDGGSYYSTAFARGDGTIYMGGIKTVGAHDFTVNEEHRKLILRNQHINQPDVFPSPDLKDYDFITDHVGVYPMIPQADGGARVEGQLLQGQKVVHAYAPEAGGFTFSFGLAREAAKLVADVGNFAMPTASRDSEKVTTDRTPAAVTSKL